MSLFQMCMDYGVISDVSFASWPSGAVVPSICAGRSLSAVLLPLLGSDPHFSSVLLSMTEVLLHLSISAVDSSDYRCVVLWAADVAVNHLWGFWSLCPPKSCCEDSSSPTVHIICHAQRNKDLSDRQEQWPSCLPQLWMVERLQPVRPLCSYVWVLVPWTEWRAYISKLSLVTSG